MAYLDHMTSGVDVASRRTLISSPLPIAIFRPDTDDIIWSNERFLHLTGDPDHLFETKLSALVPSFQSQWLLDGDHLSPEPVPVGDQLYLVFGNLVCTGGQDEFLPPPIGWMSQSTPGWRNNLTPPGLWWAFCRWTTMRT